jgi:phenylacetic acid degradation protein
MPAKVIRVLSDEEIAWKVDGTRTYQDLARRSLATMTECDPLAEIEPDRQRIHMPEVVPLVELKKR